MKLSTPSAVKLTSGYIDSRGFDIACPERALWLTVLAQAAADLRNPNKRIRRDAENFFEGPALLRVLDFAGINRDDAPWLRSRAEELAEVPSELRQRNVRLITYQGQTHSLTEWAELAGINVTTLCHRLRHGWSTARALSTPHRH